jgi:uncharacterized protein YndB with AHSA1/START domain
MSEDKLSVSTTVDAPAETVFDVLADPATHEAIDGTGWVQKSLDGQPLTGVGQLFRMAMYFGGHPDRPGDYETVNRVEVFDPPQAIAWKTGHVPGQVTTAGASEAEIEYGGWFWRYDLHPVGDAQTDVRLTYDWSAAPPEVRERIQFPPFDPSHLDNSLRHLAELAQAR